MDELNIIDELGILDGLCEIAELVPQHPAQSAEASLRNVIQTIRGRVQVLRNTLVAQESNISVTQHIIKES